MARAKVSRAPKSRSGSRGAKNGRTNKRSAPPVPGPGERVFVLDVPFEMRAVAQASGAVWNGAVGAQVFVGPSLPAGLGPFRSRPFSWERWLEDDLAGARDVSDLCDPEGVVYEPRPHQETAIEAARAAVEAGRIGFLLGDEVGVGKTISGVGAARIWLARSAPRRVMDSAGKVLVVTPKSSVPHWRRTLQRMPEAVRAMRPVIINWERLKRLLVPPESAARAKRTRTKNRRIASGGKPVETFDVVIADESHRLIDPTSQTSQAFRTLSAGAFVVWASATAGQTPLQLAYLAPLFAQVTGQRTEDLAEFEEWCRGQNIGVRRGAYGRWEWTGSEEERERDKQRMKRLLYEPGPHGPAAGIRRVPEDIAGWPRIQRVAHPMDLDATSRSLYEEAWTDFRRWMDLADRGRDPQSGLVARLRFRQKCSLLRAPATAALVREMLANGRQTAVSCEFRESISAIREDLEGSGVACSVIHGEVLGDEREAERLSFQRGQRRVCLFSVTESISLHEGEEPGGEWPRVTLVHDPRYSGIPAAQIEGRCHRDGKAGNVYYLYGEDTVEEGVVTTAIRRMKDMKQMGGDDVAMLEEMEAALLGSDKAGCQVERGE